ncbi:uncharacterized protein CTRU02_214143 [Colletotrichum truncatum]|uniref:Uncharacterized protein n=1 Tax=Colletotrichum truncatum TaxID=5467 RepID=A0ACC3YHR5_COLTU|nr:uncharacterized protein CTRU02_06455 [Colletotrichum truncatum]KAF6792958.1 hypothetical protein CTRU02_06455 [Colletotrichum truncatum]
MISAAEANGFRKLLQLQSPPRGTPSRVLSARLRRCPQLQHVLSAVAPAARSSLQQPLTSIPKSTRRFYQSDALAASHADTVAPLPVNSPGVMESLLGAVQSQDTMRIFAELKLLGQHERQDEVTYALSKLPTPVFSEVVRSLDPFQVGPQVDITHGLQVAPGLGQFSAVASIMDEFGIRKLYRNLVRLIRSVLDLRQQNGRDLMLSDYVVLLRCAGAAADIETAKWIWKVAMRRNEQKDANRREGLAYAEFMKARFLTEPLYMQYDFARFRVRPRDLTGHRKRFVNKSFLRRLERLRLSTFANSRSHYGRSPNQPTHDMHRLISLKGPVRRVWFKIHKDRVIVDQEIFCAHLIACARAGSFREMVRRIWQTWRIRITDLKDHRAAHIVGGLDRRRLDPLAIPDRKLLDALVHSFGCTGHVILARKLMIFFSARYKITIPPETWSALLEWTYITSSKPASTEWKILNDANRIIGEEDVFAIWHTMISEPFQIKPSPKDTDIYVKTLIAAGKMDLACEEIRRGREQYEAACEELQTTLFERLYPSPPPEAIDRHTRAKVKQHTTWYTVQRWCKMWLAQATFADAISSRAITNFVAEFKEILPNPITYKTTGGTVRIENPTSLHRQQWKRRVVRSPSTHLRVPDRSRPKFAQLEVESEDKDGPLVPVMMSESGNHMYEMMPITLSRLTKKSVRKRTDKVFGQKDKKLQLIAGRETGAEQIDPAIEGKIQQLQKGGYVFKRLVMRSLAW